MATVLFAQSENDSDVSLVSLHGGGIRVHHCHTGQNSFNIHRCTFTLNFPQFFFAFECIGRSARAGYDIIFVDSDSPFRILHCGKLRQHFFARRSLTD
jgi:hypothetical protein